MRRIKPLTALLLIFSMMLLTACSGGNFTMTGTGSKITIEVKDAEDGAYAESFDFSVGKDKYIAVASELDKGELQIEFAEVSIFTHDKEPDELIVGDVIETITVGPGENSELELPKGNYIMLLTTVGETNGKLTVTIEKK